MTKINSKIRIQKFLSIKGVCSRRDAEKLILKGKITVNGKKAEIAMHVNDSDYISINGKPIKKEHKKLYFLLNKPKGYLSETKDWKKNKPVTSLIKTSTHVFPVGRLDVNTSGLIFITNDGEFSRMVTLPSSGIKKTYLAKVNKIDFTNKDISLLQNGIVLDTGYKTKPAHEVTIMKTGDKYSIVKIVISEGKKNQVRKMFASLGCEVIELQRTSIGGFKIHLVPDKGKYITISYGDIQKYLRK